MFVLATKRMRTTDFPFHSPANPGNAMLLEFARREMGSTIEFENYSLDFGRPSIVWRLAASDGSRAWLKQRESQFLYGRELVGIEQFVPALGEQTWWSSPTLLKKDDEIRAVLMTGVEGEMFDSADASRDEIKWPCPAKILNRLRFGQRSSNSLRTKSETAPFRSTHENAQLIAFRIF